MISVQSTVSNPTARSDRNILDDISAMLWQEETVRLVDLADISVTVRDGAVLLEGHLAREQNKQLIESLARSVPGVSSADNQLVTDRGLVVEVAQALAKDERTRHFILRVGSYHGWISLTGEVPAPEIQSAAEEVAGRVANVRGVVALPEVPGISYPARQRAVQPRLGAKVYSENGEMGVVTQVIMDPRNRLVREAIVRSNEEGYSWPPGGEYILPVEAMDVVNKESVFLIRNGFSSDDFLAFDPNQYPLAASDWQPPYPYAPGAVRWSRVTDHDAERKITEMLFLKWVIEQPDVPASQGPRLQGSSVRVSVHVEITRAEKAG